MIATTSGSGLPPHVHLCPSPLHIHKKQRKATFRRRILPKSTHSDIGDQYELPLNDSVDLSVLDWACPVKAPPPCATLPLSISRTPSPHPLTIPKNRNSRSSASSSSFGGPMTHSRNSSQGKHVNSASGLFPHTMGSMPWPLLDGPLSESAHAPRVLGPAKGPDGVSAQQALEGVIYNEPVRNEPPKRPKSSKLRLFTNGFPLLRRQGTGDTSVSTRTVSNTVSSSVKTTSTIHDEGKERSFAQGVDESAIMAYLARNACDGEKIKSFMDLLTKHMPPPTNYEREVADAYVPNSPLALPNTLRAAIRLFPDAKVLTEDVQEVTVAIDIEGTLHNQRSLSETAIDVVFVVDNGYYVTQACLEKSLEAVKGALYHLGSGDRLALYTTHCTHRKVTGNRPDMLYPIRRFSKDTEAMVRELTATILRSGTQAWDPPRPNPSMVDVVLGIARSLEVERLKAGRTHIIVLSPAAHVLHDVSKYFADLHLHRINPAILPYRRQPEFQDTTCTDTCCSNVFASNWSKYQSTPIRIKRILRDARCTKPVGELTGLSVDVRARTGCEVIEFYGNKEIPQLYLGEVHTLFVKVRVTKGEARSINLDSDNPILNSNLDANGLRQELLNSVHVGATRLHLFDVQVLYRNSIHESQTWNYTESPLILISEMGGLAPPRDPSLEVYRRQYFYHITQAPPNEAKAVAESILDALAENNEQAKVLVECMIEELRRHLAIREYEQQCRQRLPLCPGPIEIETSHQWLMELWNHRKNKCDCIDASDRL
ncbi:hypothetical protein COCC4DRAFT_58864 [Bipolaris maydis ATCC 48331]|uniref:Uncharacterized protein n=2 Tax=Cochliobolus heterostrophus TaxID=5016 RepID=M2V0D7_COCH5|nr:uncharacterized protein COCC4DRAFT_58864 [Bipolaris maydis ATCC 48331]EMD93508.1 hypothetical protein COCHEDRAFT_1192830 [Bipolaris maydis C5]KAJ5027824.1 hypothetical protein J3E73DRAFT_430709 [Bipolaris maydis]ENI07044.1 hypothetical protein COCC4DRAFT_58864 [Bipolaris maydis ATCC 48331]KAJ6198855.1 hypothetical protein J3E72DRAFT_438253 [Bipolaris maydis]KAJ6204757.1 hypothetical protein PSV09DRAFT_1192830 [Bipolaris maydis]